MHRGPWLHAEDIPAKPYGAYTHSLVDARPLGPGCAAIARHANHMCVSRGAGEAGAPGGLAAVLSDDGGADEAPKRHRPGANAKHAVHPFDAADVDDAAAQTDEHLN